MRDTLLPKSLFNKFLFERRSRLNAGDDASLVQ